MTRVLPAILVAVACAVGMGGCHGTYISGRTDAMNDAPAEDDAVVDALDALPGDPGDDAIDVASDPGAEISDPFPDPHCEGVAGGPCHLVEQCGCPAGSFCTLYMISGECTIFEGCYVRTSMMDGEPGYLCGPPDSCRPGTICYAPPGEEEGKCHEWCMTDEDCSQYTDGARCRVTVLLTGDVACTDIPAPYLACTILY